MSQKPILIVGAGLSGLTVAFRLLAENKRVLVFDNGVNHSSQVAAGMINPMVFRRMNKSWRADACMDELTAYYREVEALTNTQFFHEITIRRLFSGEQERELWLTHQELDEYQMYLERVTPEDDNYVGAINTFGSGRVKKTAHVVPERYLNALKSHLDAQGSLRQEIFDYGKIDGQQYGELEFESIVFCEGYTNCDNPFFGKYPVEQTKGETLTIHSKTLPETESVNRKSFVLPLGNGEFMIGSTYEWNTPDLSPTKLGRETILANLAFLTEEKVEVREQTVGIRPTTLDRRPIIGRHPEHPNMYLFNGLGAKGYMLAPLLSKEFAAFLLNDTPLHPEVRLERFKKRMEREAESSNNSSK